MRRTYAVLALLLLAAAPIEAQRPGGPPRHELAEQVHARFLDEAAGRMRLDDAARRRLHAVMREHEQQRHALGSEGARLRIGLAAAIGDARTPDAEFRRLLDALDSLRVRELDVWRQEQAALAGVLTPRQQAEFAMLRARFAERIARIRADGPPPGRRPRP